IETCAACDVDHAVTRAKAECLYGPEALCPLGVAGRRVEPAGDVVVLCLLAVCLDQVLSRRVDLAHGVLLDLGSAAAEPARHPLYDSEPPGVADSTAVLIAVISRSLTR